MERHWEIAWTTLQPLTGEEVARSVEAIGRLACSLPSLTLEASDGSYIAVRHRGNDEFVLEFGHAEAAPCCPLDHGLVEDGHIVWNWCCTGGRQPETGLVIRKLREIQTICADKLLVWDDDGQCHWSWGSCSLEEAGLDPMAVVDTHLRRRGTQPLARAS